MGSGKYGRALTFRLRCFDAVSGRAENTSRPVVPVFDDVEEGAAPEQLEDEP